LNFIPQKGENIWHIEDFHQQAAGNTIAIHL